MESVKIFNEMIVSGVTRDEQRRIYDERHKEALSQHDIYVVTIYYNDIKVDSKKRIVRNEKDDLEVIRLKLKEYLK